MTVTPLSLSPSVFGGVKRWRGTQANPFRFRAVRPIRVNNGPPSFRFGMTGRLERALERPIRSSPWAWKSHRVTGGRGMITRWCAIFILIDRCHSISNINWSGLLILLFLYLYFISIIILEYTYLDHRSDDGPLFCAGDMHVFLISTFNRISRRSCLENTSWYHLWTTTSA